MRKSTLDILNNFSILTVEDDSIARAMIKQGLKEYFIAYYEAKNGLEGLEIFKKHKVDIIVVDIHMPLLNGFDMINEILALKPKQPFIVITSYDTDKNVLHSVSSGAFSFLRKPINIEDLQISLMLALSKKVEQKLVKIHNDIFIDFNKEIIYKNDKPLFLTHVSNKVFWLLCYNLNNLVSYEMIEDYAYGGKSINKNVIHTVILRIKKYLGDINIENVANAGYILKSKPTL
ncbi:MAG: response regulator transcription factor [Campylobacteraceae bacterium]|jgi:DNA-binding response OmpR family regulator|nr:response regulator transcription factor [Campylobacteraceae bacterium]